MTPVHLILLGMLLLYAVSAAVSAMPAPKREGGYSFIYKFSHIFVGNLDKLFAKKTGIDIPDVAPAEPVHTGPSNGA